METCVGISFCNWVPCFFPFGINWESAATTLPCCTTFIIEPKPWGRNWIPCWPCVLLHEGHAYRLLGSGVILDCIFLVLGRVLGSHLGNQLKVKEKGGLYQHSLDSCACMVQLYLAFHVPFLISYYPKMNMHGTDKGLMFHLYTSTLLPICLLVRAYAEWDKQGYPMGLFYLIPPSNMGLVISPF